MRTDITGDHFWVLFLIILFICVYAPGTTGHYVKGIAIPEGDLGPRLNTKLREVRARDQPEGGCGYESKIKI